MTAPSPDYLIAGHPATSELAALLIILDAIEICESDDRAESSGTVPFPRAARRRAAPAKWLMPAARSNLKSRGREIP